MKECKLFPKILFILLLPIAFIITYLASYVPTFIEKIYSNGVYKIIGQVLSNITGLLPFSAAEFLMISLILYMLWKFVTIIVMIVTFNSNLKSILLHSITNILVFVSITYFTFVFIWGFNYYRLPFSQIANLDTRPASVNELEELCESLIIRGNELRKHVHEDKDGIMYIPGGDANVFQRAFEGYEKASYLYPQLGGKYGRPKGVTFSTVMSYSGISGIYFPFTAEANVNRAIPDSMMPSTTSHEMAHQRGFSREDEANYIAYITCSIHPDVDFQYSGTLLALIHSMNTLYKYDKEKYEELHGLYSHGVKGDLLELNHFWAGYEGPIERAQSKINNAYLKANNQKDGVHSYGRMVDLLIAEHRLKSSK